MQNVLGGCTAESASNNKIIDPLKKGGGLIPGPVCDGPLRLRHPGLMRNHGGGGGGLGLTATPQMFTYYMSEPHNY